jgi:catechol 2,3-dioxygenase-like lactoylglutathione lyase family enzyme
METSPRGIPRVSHILETALYVADLDVSQTFYQRLMGFELFLRDDRMAALGVPGGGVLLLFRRGGSVEASTTPFGVIPGHNGEGHLHLAFGIPRGELARWEAHLAAQQVEIESRISWARGGTSLYFRDPDQNAVEVATPGLWANF